MPAALMPLFLLFPLALVPCYTFKCASSGAALYHPATMRVTSQAAPQLQTATLRPSARTSVRALRMQSTLPDKEDPLKLSTFFPILTILAAALGLSFPNVCAALGSPLVFSIGLALLIFSMGITLTPADLYTATRAARPIACNFVCCFALSPLVSLGLAALLGPELRAGVVLLGCVSGGQASNLCTLLAGGDVALSVVLTLSTTIAGVVLIPLLVRLCLGAAIEVHALPLLRSTATLVLAPLLLGLAVAGLAPEAAASARRYSAAVGIASTLALVVGGAANSAGLLSAAGVGWRVHVASIALPLLSAAGALGLSRVARLPRRATRAVVIETAIKSPTLAYVLAVRHFKPGTSAVPAASMVWLAAIGAGIASGWRKVDSVRSLHTVLAPINVGEDDGARGDEERQKAAPS
ncbi:hypothetical protein AB1Y20_016370 [Prymnesium parvum]|uniref:Uncharacterized protein n=1 Tax=Prymnesium parvum TaxID=97485 RepID=A0AB34IG20_PRYPA